MTTEPNHIEIRPSTRSLTILYIAALSLVACLSIAGQVLIQISLRNQLNDSTVVNIAGRQRMLSQKIAKASLKLKNATSESEFLAAKQELLGATSLWKRSHQALQHGDPRLGLPGNNSGQITRLFESINPHYRAIATAVERSLASQGWQDRPAEMDRLAAVIQENEAPFLQGMDRIVFQYNQEAQTRVATLQWIEISLLLTTLVVLCLEGWFIFRPAVRRIRSSLHEIKRVAADLVEARNAAEQASQQKTQFLANVSHELRTPMSAILGMTDLLAKTPLDSRQERLVETTYDAAKSLHQLLSDLLEVSQFEVGPTVELENQPFTPLELCLRTLRMFESVAHQRGIRLVSDMASGSEIIVLGDQDRLRQVLVNLLNNAIKFTDQGEVCLRLSCESCSPTQAQFRFSVIDTGRGIPENHQQSIFQAFSQVDASDFKRGGVGLGLSISHKLVSLMGGAIQLQSILGVGSSFSFCLSFDRVADQSDAVDSSPPSSIVETQPLHILVAEDTPSLQFLLREYLQTLGCEIEMVENGQEAIDRFDQRSFDAVLIDLNLPVIDGLTVIHRLRALETRREQPPAFLVVLTAEVSNAEESKCLAAGADRFLTKPISLEQLKATLRSSPRLVSTQDANPPSALANDQALIPAHLRSRPALFLKLSELFLSESSKLLTEMEAAFADQQPKQLRVLAHRLRGILTNFVAPTATGLATEIEEANQDQFAELERTLERLHREIEQLTAKLRAWRSSRAALIGNEVSI